MKLLLGLFLSILAVHGRWANYYQPYSNSETLPDIGVANYTCDAVLMKPSKTVPTNVNSVRPADIKIIMALGDSLTAANGAGAPHDDPVAVVLQYRGLSFQAGGDHTLETHATIPNILKKYNPKLFGYSNGIGSPNVWEISRLNVAMPGAHAKDMPGQARQLVQLLQQHPESVNFKEDWKLLNLFIGGNDACGICDHTSYSAQTCANQIEEAVKIIHDNVPRTIVSITGMLHVDMLRKTDKHHAFCTALHKDECGCESDLNYTNQELSDYCVNYADGEMAIQTSGKYEKDDFTVVVQPFFRDVTDPPYNPDGTINMGFFAPDCFHFSQFGHAMVSTWVWKNILEPVGAKTTKGSVSDPALPLACPDPNCPFIRTPMNSQNCQKYMTPVHN